MRNFLLYLKIPLFLPHYVFFLFYRKPIIEDELIRWGEVLRINRKTKYSLFFYLICNIREYRSLFYHRLGGKSLFISWYSPGMINLYLGGSSKTFSKGFVIQHGHSSRFATSRCGENCQIWHNITVGKAHSGGGLPELGNNVKVSTGACVIGEIIIGNNVTIGAGAIITKDVPDNSVVVGNPARIIRLNGEKVNILL